MSRNVGRVMSIAFALPLLAPPIFAQAEKNQSAKNQSTTNQSARHQSYVWLGEVVFYETQSKTVTVKAPYREHINRYIGEFNRGDQVMLTWATPRPGETEAIIYVGRYDPAAGKWGYVLPVQFVSADTAQRRLTFTVALPSKALNVMKTVPSGGWIRVTTPFDQRNAAATIERVEAAPEPQRTSS